MSPIRSFAIAISFLLLSYIGLAQQLKLGKNPYTVQKSAILELQSDNQGLLLTRIADTASINLMSPPDGMMIYFTPTKNLLIRTNGHWQPILTTVDTSSIPNFYFKTRSLFSATAPIIYNNATGQIGITQATASANGYLSSADWNTFNNKAGSFVTGNLTETGSGILTIAGGTNAVIGSGTSIQVKQANTSQNGFLSSTDWNTFNGKLSTIDTTNISNFYLKVRKNLSAGTGIGYSITSGVISNTGVLSVNGNTGTLTMDTSYISNFYLKTRSLFSNTAPITYNNATGAIGITQASTSTNGYLSSADWNTFNNKASAFTTGNLTETGSGILTITGGTGAVAGSGTAIQVKQASTSQNGFLSSTDWNTFNNKLSTIDTTNISNFYLKVRGLHTAGPGIGYSNTTGVISNTGVLSLNGNTGALTMDTGYISNFSVKARSLFSSTAPITYSNGLIGITQASISTNGYLSSADWNTFNNKAASFTTGNLTETGSGILTITGGTGAVAGSGTSIQVKQASTSQNGFLSSTDWNIFNNKLSTVDTSNISNFYLKVRGLHTAGPGIGYSNTTGVISNTGVLSLNGNTGALTMDTGYISNFSVKARSLFSSTAPITYGNGLIGITQATTSTNGYLSSADWNTFNNKAASFTTGNLTETGSGILTITGGTGAVAGSGTAIQVKQASTSQNGFLSSTDWNIFNNKLSTIDTGNISNFYLKVRGLHTAGPGIGYSNTTGVISNTGVLSLNGNTGALTMDTGYINNFSVKTRSLFSSTAPITYANGLIGITQASTSTNGYLSSADWNTFNNKAASFTTGNLTETGSGILTITGGTGAVAGIGTAIQVKQASTSQNGFLSSTDWNTFNNKLSTIDTSNISNFYLKVRGLHTAGPGIGYSNTTGVISNTGVLSLNGNTGALTMDTGYISNFSVKTRSLFSAGAGITYNAATGLISSSTSTANLWAYGGNTVGAIKTIGTSDNYDFPFITNNTEKMRLSNTGNLGIGAAAFDATYPEKLLVNTGATSSVNAIAGKGTINNYLQLNIQNQSAGTNASSDLVATADNGSETNNYVDMGINSSANTSGAMGGANDAYLYNIGQNLLVGTGSASKSLVFMTGGTSQSTNERMRIDGSGNVGIGNNTPAQKLDLTGNFKLTGAFMPAGSAGNTGEFLTSAGAGFSPTWTNATSYLNSNAWLRSGNSGTTSATDFIGTTDYTSFKIKTNNTQGFILDSLGNVGIGDNPGFTAGANRENLLVDAGPTASVNAIVGRGSINSYLQLNIQNQSTGTSASSDVVATANNGDETTNYVDMGINGGNYTGGVMGAANDSYLYNLGQNFLIGTGTAAKSLVFMTGGTTQSSNERMRIDGTGKVGIGTNAPASDLTLFQANGGANPARGFRFTGNSISGNNSGTGFNLALGYNITNNKQLWLGDADYLGSNSGTFLRYSITNGFPTFDAVSGDGANRRTIALGVGGDPTSAIILGGDFTATAPSSYIWGNGNMAIGASYRANAAPTNGLIVQGNAGIGLTAPTAALQLRAGNATASTGAPLKFTSGTNLTTAEDGAVEYDGTNYYATSGTTRYTLAKTLTATASLDFPNVIGISSSTLTITVNGAVDGDVVSLGVPNTLASVNGVVYSAYVSAANTVTVKFTNNNSLTGINPAAATFRVTVIKY